jgi:hypothetical protein
LKKINFKKNKKNIIIVIIIIKKKKTIIIIINIWRSKRNKTQASQHLLLLPYLILPTPVFSMTIGTQRLNNELENLKGTNIVWLPNVWPDEKNKAGQV